jgi:transposase
VGSKSSRRYPEELKSRAVQMVADLRSDTTSEWEAMGRVADLLGVGTAETVRKWVRQAEIDAGDRAGQTTEESEVLRKLRRENAELKRANAILKAASVFFAAELDRPSQ